MAYSERSNSGYPGNRDHGAPDHPIILSGIVPPDELVIGNIKVLRARPIILHPPPQCHTVASAST